MPRQCHSIAAPDSPRRRGQRQRERAAGPATGQAAAAGSRDSGERSVAANTFQLGRVARGRAFLAVEARVQRTVRTSAIPSWGVPLSHALHRRRHVDEDELVLIGVVSGTLAAMVVPSPERCGFEGALGPTRR